MKTLLMISMLTFSSCASARWKVVQVPFEKQTWRICSKDIDGEKLHLKGFCYWQKEVKNRIWPLKDLFRRVHKVCLFKNKECLLKFQLSGKKIQ